MKCDSFRKGSAGASNDHGSFTVELVVLAPVLMIMALLSVALGRYELVRDEVAGATGSAAEAASMVASGGEAQPAAVAEVRQGIEGLGHSCSGLQVSVDTSNFVPGGSVRVTVVCRVDFSDLLVPGLPGSAAVASVQVAPVDPYRSIG